MKIFFKLLKLLSRKEKLFVFCLLFVFFISFYYLFNFFYQKIPTQPKEGGEFIEGILGSPSFLIPIYENFSLADSDFVSFVFSPLFKFENGQLLPHLVENYKISEDGKSIDFKLRENIFWHDGEKMKSADVVFTIDVIKNPKANSPLAPLWVGIEAEEISEIKFRLKFKNPISEKNIFLLAENLSLKIIPKHIFEKFSLEKLPFLQGNFEIVGSGPFKVKEVIKDKSGKITKINLWRNEKYFGKKPYLKKVTLKFFENEKELLLASNKKEIMALSFPYFNEDFFPPKNLKTYRFLLPRYYAVFFNLEKDLFSQKSVRQALALATDKKRIFEKIFFKEAKIIHSPFLSEFYQISPPKNFPKFDLKESEEILAKDGFEVKEGKREKILVLGGNFQFKNDLQLGSIGDEVKELQKCLKKEGFFDKEINGIFDRNLKTAVKIFQEKYLEEILKPSGLQKGNGKVGPATRKKLNEICFEKKEKKIELQFTLTTLKEPLLEKIASYLKEDWEKLGAEIEIKSVDLETLKREILPKKNYDAILIGENLTKNLNPYIFWHSSQKDEFGLNLSKYEKEQIDKLLEEIMIDFTQKGKLEKIQEILIEENPAIFLANPYYLYFVNEKINGIENKKIFTFSERFAGIENWWLKEKLF